MEPQLSKFSLVVTAEHHNPTILNADFLAVRDIVSSEWGWQRSRAVVTTPPFSQVQYDNGLSITVEPDKLRVIVAGSEFANLHSRAVTIVQRYVGELDNVRYKAVGINFDGFLEHSDPARYLKGRFLKSGPWDSESHTLSSVAFQLVYPLQAGRLVLALDAGRARPTGADATQTLSTILARANFHRHCSNFPADREVSSYVENVQSDWSKYRSLLDDVLDVERGTDE